MIEVFTDGGCSGNPGPGAWAFIVLLDGREYRDSGGERETTNNRMELTAVIRALVYIEEYANGNPARITTDSQYVQLGITRWINAWERNGWRTADKKPVKNRELWQKLRELSGRVRPEWAWVKGHAGHPVNEACDSLVQDEIKKMRK